MTLFRALPRRLTRRVSLVVILAWLVTLGVLVQRSYLRAAPVSLAGDLARFGSSAQWRGVYYRGEKVGFVVGETRPVEGGYELVEEGRLQMRLLGSASTAALRTRARVDEAWQLRSFSFSLDPGTGPVEVEGRLEGQRLELDVRTAGGERRQTLELPEPPALNLSLPRRLAAQGLRAGQRLRVPVFDPATLTNAPLDVVVEARELVRAGGLPIPAFRIRTSLAGITSTSWVTDVGEVLREESPMGLVVVKESRERALSLATPPQLAADMIEAAAIAPTGEGPVDEPSLLTRLRLRLSGLEAGGADLQGAGQTVEGDVFELQRGDSLPPVAAEPDLARHLEPEPLVESDAPEIRTEAERALAGLAGNRARAERLVRHVHALVEKRPTLSLPSALEVLRTRVGDCNEHTALYVALARAAGLPSRVAVGLVYLRGAFYYHAWPEVWVEEAPGRGRWLAADPTLNQFPADVTHVRLARGGLDRQVAILPLIGRGRIEILEIERQPGALQVLVGAETPRPASLEAPGLVGAAGTGRPRCRSWLTGVLGLR